MATGRKTDFSGSSVKDSDFCFEFTCNPCTKYGLNNEAIYYCVECSEYFCGDCTEYHKMFGATSDHNVVNRTLAKRPGGVTPSPVVRETCREHHGERLTTYCADDDLVVCNICVSVDHRLCDGVSYIPKVAGGAKQSREINKVQKQISESLETNDQTKDSLQRSLASADQEKKDQHKRIHDYTERLIKHARNMEKAAIVDVDNHHKIATEKLRSGIRSLDDASTIMKSRLASLSNAKTNSEVQVFVDFKRGSEEVETFRQLQQELAPSVAGKLMPAMSVADDVEYYLTEVRLLGAFTENKALRAELLGEYNVDTLKDKAICAITGSCDLPDGTILIADWWNKCLKKLSKSSFKVKERLAMASYPFDICRISDDEVAVTLTVKNTVQFVNVAGRLRLTRSFKVGDCCRGILCNRDELFVVCGGFPGDVNLGPDKGPGHVEVYDLSGSPLRTIQFDHRGWQLFSWPECITVPTGGDKLHISDGDRGVITVDRQGRVLSTFSHDVLQFPGGICTVTGDNVLVCGFDSHNVVQLGPDGEMVAQLLTGKDGIKKPTSLRPHRDNSRLIVTELKSDTIKVYSLKA